MLHHKIFKESKIQNSSLTQQIEITACLCRLQEVTATYLPNLSCSLFSHSHLFQIYTLIHNIHYFLRLKSFFRGV